MKSTDQIDFARLAAYIDGEGCIFIRVTSSKRPWHELRLSVNNTDPRLVLWCKQVCRAGCVQKLKSKKKNRRAVFEWIVSGPTAARILADCLPYFLLKKDQAELGIAFQKTKTRSYSKRGIPAQVLLLRRDMQLEIRRLKHVEHVFVN